MRRRTKPKWVKGMMRARANKERRKAKALRRGEQARDLEVLLTEDELARLNALADLGADLTAFE